MHKRSLVLSGLYSATVLLFVTVLLPSASAQTDPKAPQDPPASTGDGGLTSAQEHDVPVGMTLRLPNILLEGPPLVAVRPARHEAFVLRIAEQSPHGTMTRYTFECYALEPGLYNLTDALRRPDDSIPEGLPEINVKAIPQLPPGQVLPAELEVLDPPKTGGYRTWLIAGGILWIFGLITLLYLRFRKPVTAEERAKKQKLTLADRLRPLVKAASRGELDSAGNAELERLLLATWRHRLNMGNLQPAEAMTKLREHPDAGALMRALEDRLHRAPDDPAAKRAVDFDSLLKAYEEFTPDAPETSASPLEGARAS